jgi:hypothetical protein
MAKKSRLPLIGVTLVTPALMTAGALQASVAPVSSFQQPSLAASKSNIAAQARLKVEILSLGREEKLRIAGNRIQLASMVRTASKGGVCPTNHGCATLSINAGGARAHLQGAAITDTNACPKGVGAHVHGAALMSAAHTCGCKGAVRNVVHPQIGPHTGGAPTMATCPSSNGCISKPSTQSK